MIDGRILVKIVRCDGEVVKLGIEAPLDVPVHRQEIYDEIQRNNQQALTRSRSAMVKLGSARLPDKLAALVPENAILVPSA